MFKMDMCNCLKKCKTQFSLLKKLTGVLIFLFVSASLWATDYYWIGGDSTSATWADGNMWSLDEGGTSAAAYPGNSDTAIIKNTVTFTDTTVTCDAINSSKALSFSGNLTLTSASTIDGGLNIGGNLTLSGGLTLSSGDLSVTGDTTNNNAGTILISSGDCILADYISYDSNPSSVPFNTIECSGVLQATGGQFRGDISAGSITISGDASLLGATHTISSTGTQHYGGEILVNSSSGSLELIGSTITFDANIRSWNNTAGTDQKALIITGNAVFKANAGATNPLKSLSVSGTTKISGASISTNEGQIYSGEVEISSSTSLTSTSNKSITFNDVLTIDNGKTLNLNGSPAISSLVMDGSSLALSNSANLIISNLILTSSGGGTSNNTLTAGNGSITVSNATYYSNNLTTSGNVSLAAGSIGTLTADGNTTLAGGSISTLAVTGSNLTLTGDLEVTTLSLTGTALTNLELSGSGHSIILSSNQTSGSYLKIASDIYIKSSASAAADGVTGRYYQASDSIPSAGSSNNDYATVIKNGWRIKDFSLMDYTWTGSTSTDWADGSNWGLGITPGSGDTAGVDVTIPAGASNYPIISDKNYTLKDLTIESAAELSVNGKNLQAESLDCGGKINLSSAELEITDSITSFEELNLNDSTFTNSTGNSISINTALLNGSTIRNTSTSGTLSITTLNLGSSESSLNAGTSSITVANNITSGKLKTYGNISTAALSLSSLNVSSETLTASGNVDISGASSALVVDGTLDMDSGSYELTLTGTSSDLLKVSGSGSISLSSSQITGDYISLEGSLSIANSKIYTAIHSQNTQSAANPYNGWNIRSGDLIYIWDGSDSTSLSLAENWLTDLVPGISDDILIPSLTGTSPNYPLLTAAAEYNKVTVDTDAQLNLASYNLAASEITNNGLVRLAGSQTVTATTITNDSNSTVEYYGTLSGGNLPMKGTSTSFGKLLFSDGANGTISDAISVAGTTDILCGTGKTLSLTGANTFTGLVKIGDSTTSENGGQITINSAAGFTLDSNALADSLDVSSSVVLSGDVETVGGGQTYTGAVTTGSQNINLLAGTDTVTFRSTFTGSGNALAVGNTTTASNARFYNTVSGFTTLSVAGTTQINTTSITTTEEQTYTGAVSTGSQDLTLLAGTDTVTFLSTLTGSGNALSVGNTTTASNARFSDTVSGFSTLSVEGTTQIDATSITTSGGQTYTGAVSTGSQNLTLLAGTDPVSFLSTLTGSGNTLSVGNSTTASNVIFSDAVAGFSTLSVAGTTQINTSSITTTGGQTYHGGVTTGSQNLTLLSGTDTISFLSTLTGSGKALSVGNTTTASNVIFSDAVAGFSTLSVAGTTQIDTSSITTTGGQTYTGNVTTSSTNTNLTATNINSIINFKADISSSTNNLTLTAGTSLTSGSSATITAGNIQINGNYENTGSITSNAVSTSVTNNVTNTGTAIFTNGISLAGNFTDTIGDWTGSITLNGTDAQNFNPNTASLYSNIFINKTDGKTNFTDTVSINTLRDSNSYTADIVFYKNLTIETDTNLNTSGKIIFTSQADSTNVYNSTFGSGSTFKDFTHTNGQTILNGNINADEITLDESILQSVTNINCTNLTLQNNLTTSLDTYYLKLTGNLTTSGTIEISPDVMIDGSFIGGGSSTFKKNLYFFKDSSTASTASINSLTVDGNLIIAAERNFNTAGTITTKQNFVLYQGQITAAASSIIHADLDIILLGQFYSLNDASRSSNPSNTDYIYQQSRTNGSCNYTRTDFSVHNDQMPDGTYLPASTDGFTGLYTGANASVLHAGKNWYANGLKDSDTSPSLGLTASSQWYIDIPNLTDTQNQTGFAETYNSFVDHNTIRCHTPPAGSSSPDPSGTYSRMPAYDCSYQADSNGDALTDINWLFTDLLITQAWTERDNSIYLTFNRAIRNTSNELKNAISRFSNSSTTYQGFYTTPDCTTAIPDNQNLVEDSASGNLVWVYLKAADSTSWNTDATGTSSGNSASTNRYGIHQSVIPYIKVSENNSYPITDIWGKRLAYYDGTNPFENVTDHTGPVLYSVRTGQEFHSSYNSSTGESSQPSYDSHNFLEFRYSEAVNFGSTTAGTSTPLQNVFDNSDITSAIWLPAAASTSADNTVNIRVRDSFGALTNSITQSGNLTLAGLATIENGKLHTASQGSDNKYVNALYRQDAFSIRLSLAGYTEGTATDQYSNIYKKWTGYIESAIQPSGLVSLVADTNNLITDCALDSDGVTPLYNPQIRYADDATVTPSVNIIYSNGNQYDSSGIYGNWDLSEPVFATLRLDSSSDWAESQYFEAVGTNSGSGSTLDKIEFHIFDNTPAYSSSDTAIWLTEKGWVTNTPGSSTLYDASYSYCADITGGSKQFDSDSSQRSSGGIRYSTLETSSAGFKYSSGQGSSVVPSTNFVSGITGIYTGAKASLFVGSSTTRRSPTDPDGLYFGLGLSDTNFPVSQSFTVSYDENSAYVTDLAGNRLRSKTIRTIDRTPPAFDITLSPVSQKELNVVFVKKLITDTNSIKYRDNTNGDQINITESYENLIPKCFDLISISSGSASTSSSINIDYTVPAKIQHIASQTNDSEFTVITLTLTQNISLNDLQNLYIRLIYADGYQELTQDPVTGINNSRVTFIQDELGNYMQMYSAHAISDFAINVINPLYAYDTEMTYNSESLMDGLYNEGSWAVHDWNADQQNYGSLPANHEYELIADIDDGTEDKTYLPSGVRAYFAINQTSNSVSSQYNSDLNTSLRVWLPALSNSVIAALSPVNNALSNILTKDSVTLDSETPERINFTIGKDFSTTWGSGKQISFLFGLLDTNNEIIRIYNAPYYDVTNNTYNLALSTAVPLFALRTKDSSVLSSLDLWSFKTHASVEQRGGVTILNNVIDLSKGEKTVLKVNNPSNGKVNIMVMTLDGNIITYLNRGNLTSGQHYFYWDGKNKKNNQVARGMYFIRIVGNGFDETRKVLVTK